MSVIGKPLLEVVSTLRNLASAESFGGLQSDVVLHSNSYTYEIKPAKNRESLKAWAADFIAHHDPDVASSAHFLRPPGGGAEMIGFAGHYHGQALLAGNSDFRVGKCCHPAIPNVCWNDR